MGISYRRHHFVATTELFNSKLKRFMFERANCIEIDRQNVSMQSFNKIIEHLNAGRLVSMFPEGRMTKNEEVQTFKSGMVLMALRANVPIIPVYIKRRKNYWQRQKYVIGEPINPVEMVGKIPSLEKINQVTNLLKEKEAELKKIADQYK